MHDDSSHPTAVRAAEELKAAAAGEDGASEKFMTDRRHLHHVNTTDKMFLSAPRRKQSAFMADTEQKTGRWNYPAIGAGIGKPFEVSPACLPAHTLCSGRKGGEKDEVTARPWGNTARHQVPAPKKKKKSHLNFV